MTSLQTIINPCVLVTFPSLAVALFSDRKIKSLPC